MFKYFLITAIACSLLMACGNQTPQEKQNETKELVELSDTLPVNTDTFKEEAVEIIDTRLNVSGKVIFSNPLCGGAPSFKENIKEVANFAPPEPLSNTTVLLKDSKDKKNTLKITTDNKGHFKAHIEPGTYGFYMTKSFDENIGCWFDPTCPLMLNQQYGKVVIKQDKTSGYEMYFYFPCNPCTPPPSIKK